MGRKRSVLSDLYTILMTYCFSINVSTVKAVKTKILRSRELLEMPIAELDTITEEKNDTEEVIEVAEEDLSLTQANNRKKRFNIEQEMAKLPDSKKV